MNNFSSLAVIGSGPSAIYLLKYLLGYVRVFRPWLTDIHVFEKSSELGTGMPYSRSTTDKYNMCNISSAEIPELSNSLVDWLHSLTDEELKAEGIERNEVGEDEIYRRTTLGDYFRNQYSLIIDGLRKTGLTIHQHSDCLVTDLVDAQPEGEVRILCATGTIAVDRAVIATGHAFNEPDEPNSGDYASPWPIQKLIPVDGQYYNFEIGTLGSSLSAFDVVASLSHRHGKFSNDDGKLTFEPAAGTQDLRHCVSSRDWHSPLLVWIASDVTAAIVVSSWLQRTRGQENEPSSDVETVTEVYEDLVNA